jgi:hypothetical protein
MSDPLAAPQADIGAALTDMWRSVLLFVPKALAFIAILIIGYFVAKFVLKVVDRVLERVGFDRAVERSGLGRTLARARYDASDILARLAYYTVLLFTLQLAFGVWGPNPISDLISAVISWLPRAFVAILIIVVAAAIAAAVRDLITGALGGLSYGRLIANVVSIFIIALGVIAALNQVGIATTVTQPVLVAVLATVAGILIVGVGGGLVRPMQRRWEGWLDRMATESAVIRERAKAYQAEKAEEERRKVDEERRRADEERRRADEAAAAREATAATTVTVPAAASAGGSPNPPAPAYPPAPPKPAPTAVPTAAPTAAPTADPAAVADPAAGTTPTPPPPDDETAGERTQVIPRADIEAASVPPADRPGPVAGAMPPPAPEATRELPAVNGDDGAIYQSGSVPDPSVDGNGPAKTPVEDDETQVIRRQDYGGR